MLFKHQLKFFDIQNYLKDLTSDDEKEKDSGAPNDASGAAASSSGSNPGGGKNGLENLRKKLGFGRGGRPPVHSLSALTTDDPEGLFAQQLSGPCALLLEHVLNSLHFLLERDMRSVNDFVYALLEQPSSPCAALL